MELRTSKEEKVGVVVVCGDICVGCDYGGGCSNEKDKAVAVLEVMPIKQVPFLEKDHDHHVGGGNDGGAEGNGGCGASVVGDLVTGGEGGGGNSFQNSVPRFLTKTFEMVEDPQIDDLISWSLTSRSFVIWDHLKFSANLLPKHFRHSNFSSFIYQLNAYGFKKIDTDRWEYANEWFQANKKHLLRNIERRRPSPQRRKQKGLAKRLQMLRTDHNIMNAEILKLKEKQNSMEHYLAAMEQCFGSIKCNQQEETSMFEALANPEFLQQFTQYIRKERERNEMVKKRRLVVPQSSESSAKAMEHFHSKVVLELEDLFGHTTDWAAYVKDLMQEN